MVAYTYKAYILFIWYIHSLIRLGEQVQGSWYLWA